MKTVELEKYTAVNFEWKRPPHLHPALLGPSLPGNPLKNEFGFYDEYSWNSAHSRFSIYHGIAVLIFMGLILLIMAVLIRSSKFLSFFVC